MEISNPYSNSANDEKYSRICFLLLNFLSSLWLLSRDFVQLIMHLALCDGPVEQCVDSGFRHQEETVAFVILSNNIYVLSNYEQTDTVSDNFNFL